MASDEQVQAWAEAIWDYHLMKHTLEPADCILALGSNDLRVAEHAATVYTKGLAPILVCSGGVAHEDDVLATGWDAPEAVKFAETAKRCGVPQEDILLEVEATNTGENIQRSRELLRNEGMEPSVVIVVQKPFMERRAYATFKAVWPEPKVLLTSPPIDFDAYPTEALTRERIIHTMVGDLQRIKIYPEKGFQIAQDIPDDVWRAYRNLVEEGFTDHLVT